MIFLIQDERVKNNLFTGNKYSSSRYVRRSNTSNSYSGSIIDNNLIN